jgi:hypothetical protein
MRGQSFEYCAGRIVRNQGIQASTPAAHAVTVAQNCRHVSDPSHRRTSACAMTTSPASEP